MLEKLFANSSGDIILVEKTVQGFRRLGAFKEPVEAEQAARGKQDVYFKINRMDTAKINIRNKHGIGGRNEVSSINVIGLDLDVGKKSDKYLPRDEVLKRLEQFTPAPSIITESDGPEGGLHVYWVLDKPVEVDESVHERSTYYWNEIASQFNRKLSTLLGGAIDNTGQIERLLRPAGSLRASGHEVKVILDSGQTYTIDLEVPKPEEKIIPTAKRECSPILDALEAEGIFSVEDYLAHRLNWEHLGGTEWRRPGSSSGQPSGTTFVAQNGELGVTIKTSAEPQLKPLQWYSLASLHVALEFAGDWNAAATVARRKMVIDPSSMFSNINDAWEMDELTDLAIAIRSQAEIQHMAYVPEWESWLYFNGVSWVPDRQSARLREYVLEATRKAETRSIVDDKARVAWIKHVKSYKDNSKFSGVDQILRARLLKDTDDFDQDPLLLHCPNTVIDLHNAVSMPTSGDYLNSKVTGCEYDAHADCPRWMLFLEEVTGGNKQLEKYLKRIAGYCATGIVTEEIMMILVGEGANGKSMFVNTIQAALGDYATTLPRSVLGGSKNEHPTALTQLYRTRFAATCETDANCTLHEGQVKAITSTDKITARKMRENFWSFTPTAKIVLSTNYIPRIMGTDDGIWRRVKLVPFDQCFKGSKKDVHLARKLHKELPGILRWIVEGAWEYLNCGLGAEPTCVTAMIDSERQEMDIIGLWIEEKCIKGENLQCEFRVLFEDFREHCKHYNLPAVSSTRLARRLTKEGFLSRTIKEDGKAKKTRDGISLVNLNW